MSSCGNTDFAITLHPAQQAYVSKTEGYTSDSVASEFPAGSDEMIQVYIETAGYYAISVWKVDQAYLPEVGRAYAEEDPGGVPSTFSNTLKRGTKWHLRRTFTP